MRRRRDHTGDNQGMAEAAGAKFLADLDAKDRIPNIGDRKIGEADKIRPTGSWFTEGIDTAD